LQLKRGYYNRSEGKGTPLSSSFGSWNSKELFLRKTEDDCEQGHDIHVVAMTITSNQKPSLHIMKWFSNMDNTRLLCAWAIPWREVCHCHWRSRHRY